MVCTVTTKKERRRDDMADTKLPNGIYAGFRTSGRAEFFAKEHNVEHYEIIWSQAEESWAVIVDD